MTRIYCYYHPESVAIGRCGRCGQPICSTCSVLSINYLTRASQRLCKSCSLKSEVRMVAAIIGVFVPFVLVASFAWAFFIVAPIVGWLYLVCVPAISVAFALRYYRRKINAISRQQT